MSEDHDRHITQEELHAFREYIDEKFKAQFNRTLLVVGVAVGLIRFDLPKEATVGALLLIAGKGVYALVARS